MDQDVISAEVVGMHLASPDSGGLNCADAIGRCRRMCRGPWFWRRCRPPSCDARSIDFPCVAASARIKHHIQRCVSGRWLQPHYYPTTTLQRRAPCCVPGTGRPWAGRHPTTRCAPRRYVICWANTCSTL